MAMKRGDRKAYDILFRAVESFEAKTGEKVFMCGKYTDKFTHERSLIARGPREVAEEYVNTKEEEQLRNIHDVNDEEDLPVYGLPDLRDQEWSTISNLRFIVPTLVSVENSDAKPHWGDDTWAPVWWPSEVPFINPKQGVTVRQMQQVVVAAYRHYRALSLLGDKGRSLVKEFR